MLEAAYAIADESLFPEWPDQMRYPPNGDRPSVEVFANAHTIIGDWRSRFLEVGAPLIFVTTFKLLDMLVEWVLFNQDGSPPSFRFGDKIEAIKKGPSFPPFIQSRNWLQERLVGLYEHLEPLRGTVIHHRRFKTSAGRLVVSSSKGNSVGPVVTLEPKDLRSVAVLLVSVLRYVDGSWELDAYREKLLRWSLDELVFLHGCPTLGQQRPRRLTVRVYTSHRKSIGIDVCRIRDDVGRNCPGQDVVFDLRVVVVTHDGTAATAYLLPWNELELESDRLVRKVAELSSYRTELPSDVDPSRVARDLKANPADKRVAG